jgi:succinoglycan biosynthesis protein ExoM
MTPLRILVAIPTYARPEGLRRTLQSLAGQEQEAEAGFHLEVAVIDNNPNGEGAAITQQIARDYPWPLHSLRELQPGVSHVRNRAIELVHDGFDALAFIDDDEVAAPDWIKQLIRVLDTYQADVVSGPVDRVFSPRAPSWAHHVNFFRMREWPDAFRLPTAPTGNVLVRAETLRRTGLRFDPRLALAGGEDTLFFRQLARNGVEIRWAANARVTEWVDDRRVDLRWLFRRSIGLGASYAQVEWILHARPRALFNIIAMLARTAAVTLRSALILSPLSRRSTAAWKANLLSPAGRFLGLLMGLSGATLKIYGPTEDDIQSTGITP